MDPRVKKFFPGAVVCLALAVIIIVICQLFFRHIGGEDLEDVSEIPLTPEYVESLRNWKITPRRAVSASSYGGWHGDGEEVTAISYAPGESEALIAELKKDHPDYVWSERDAGFISRAGAWDLLPGEMLPESDSRLLVGHSKTGSLEYVVDLSRSIYYSILSRS